MCFMTLLLLSCSNVIRLKVFISLYGICWSMCLTYIVAEVTHCKQADIDFRGHEEIYSEPGGVMDYEEDRSRPKRWFNTFLPFLVILLPWSCGRSFNMILYLHSCFKNWFIYHQSTIDWWKSTCSLYLSHPMQ